MKILFCALTAAFLIGCASKSPTISNSHFEKEYNYDLPRTLEGATIALEMRGFDEISVDTAKPAIIARNKIRAGQGDEQIGLFFQEMNSNRTKIQFTYEKGLWGAAFAKDFSSELSNEIQERISIQSMKERIESNRAQENTPTNALTIYQDCMKSDINFSGQVFKPYEIRNKAFVDAPLDFTMNKASRAIDSESRSLFTKARINQSIGSLLMLSWFGTLFYFQHTNSKTYYDEEGNAIEIKMATTRDPLIAGLFVAWPIAGIAELIIGEKQRRLGYKQYQTDLRIHCRDKALGK